ncbi:hypothetical protein TPA0909_20270 [Streptomyces albus]|nr:hypothetical protein TPA0909_20270 [Streptomyces albus]
MAEVSGIGDGILLGVNRLAAQPATTPLRRWSGRGTVGTGNGGDSLGGGRPYGLFRRSRRARGTEGQALPMPVSACPQVRGRPEAQGPLSPSR